jgi:hypothetical protein
MTRPPKSDRIGMDYREGPNPAPGGTVDTGDRATPPYEGRQETRGTTSSSDAQAGSISRAMGTTDAGRVGATSSGGTAHPVRDDELTRRDPEPALGVGVSMNRRGEEAGRGMGTLFVKDVPRIWRAGTELVARFRHRHA